MPTPVKYPPLKKIPPKGSKHRRKFGDVREDGFRFRAYQVENDAAGRRVYRERWVSPKVFAKIAKYQKKWSQENRDHVRAIHKQWRDDNQARHKRVKELWNEANREKVKDIAAKWRERNRDKKKENQRRYYLKARKSITTKQRERRQADPNKYNAQVRDYLRRNPNARIASNLRCRFRLALKGHVKDASMKELMGCSIEKVRAHLEAQFDEHMSWSNYGIYWQIDHIRPLALFDLSDSKEQRKACNWKNLRPLHAAINAQLGGELNRLKRTRKRSASKK